MDRHETGAWGLFGGQEGASGAVRIRKEGDDRWRTFSEVYGTPSPNKFADIQIQAGDEIRIVSPGGGGYGPAQKRDPSEVLDDVREGLVSPKKHGIYTPWHLLRLREIGILMKTRQPTFDANGRYPNGSVGTNF